MRERHRDGNKRTNERERKKDRETERQRDRDKVRERNRDGNKRTKKREREKKQKNKKYYLRLLAPVATAASCSPTWSRRGWSGRTTRRQSQVSVKLG